MLTKLGISLTYAAMLFCSFYYTGGCLNPAVGIAQIALVGWYWPDTGTWLENEYFLYPSDITKYWWFYLFAPLTGGILAGFVTVGHGKLSRWLTEEG